MINIIPNEKDVSVGNEILYCGNDWKKMKLIECISILS